MEVAADRGHARGLAARPAGPLAQAPDRDRRTARRPWASGFRSVTEAIDTTTSGGKLVFHIFAALAEFERTLIRERTRAGLKAARARGRQGGRPKTLSEDKRRMAQALRDDPGQSVASICKALGITRTTFYRYTRQAGAKRSSTDQVRSRRHAK